MKLKIQSHINILRLLVTDINDSENPWIIGTFRLKPSNFYKLITQDFIFIPLKQRKYPTLTDCYVTKHYIHKNIIKSQISRYYEFVLNQLKENIKL